MFFARFVSTIQRFLVRECSLSLCLDEGEEEGDKPGGGAMRGRGGFRGGRGTDRGTFRGGRGGERGVMQRGAFRGGRGIPDRGG